MNKDIEFMSPWGDFVEGVACGTDRGDNLYIGVLPKPMDPQTPHPVFEIYSPHAPDPHRIVMDERTAMMIVEQLTVLLRLHGKVVQ